MAAQLDTLTCNGCGASLAYAAGIQALECEYCKATTPIPRAERAERASDDSTQLLIPLTVDQDALEQALLRHLASGRYTKDDLVARAVLTSAQSFYAPAFVYSGSYLAHWTASFGYNRSETYVDTVRRTENGQTRREAVSRTRTVTDWDPASGSDAGSFVLLGYCGSGLPAAALELLEHSAGVRAMTTYSPAYASGLETQPSVLNQQDTWAQRVSSRLDAIIEAGVKGHAQGNDQRDWHWSANIDKKVSPVLVPVCQLQYEYKGKTYQAWIDGADPSRVAGERLPTSFGRRIRLFMGYFIPFWVTVAFLMWEPFADSWLPARVAAVAALWGHVWWRRRRVFQHSLQTR